jgi:hypothetical protein
MASVFRWIISTVWTILIVPVLALVWHGVLDRGDVATHPVDWLMGWLASFAQIPGMYASALIATGVLIGVWGDWLLRKFDGSRSADREALGIRFCNLAHTIENRFQYDDVWSANIHDLKPNLMSAFIEAEGFGIWTPVDELYSRQGGGAILVNYLRIVGTMLRDGHVKQAKKRSIQVRDFVAQSAKSATSA